MELVLVNVVDPTEEIHIYNIIHIITVYIYIISTQIKTTLCFVLGPPHNSF